MLIINELPLIVIVTVLVILVIASIAYYDESYNSSFSSASYSTI